MKLLVLNVVIVCLWHLIIAIIYIQNLVQFPNYIIHIIDFINIAVIVFQ